MRFHSTLHTALLLTLFPGAASAAQPYPESDLIADIQLDWTTHQRHAQGSDNFQLTWADDDHLYGAWGDGGGFGGTNSRGRASLGIARIEGPAIDYRGFNAWGGYEPENAAQFQGKSWAMICINGTLYMWVVPDVPDGKTYRNHYEYVELARSDNHGATWTKAPWKFRQAEKLTIPTFLNFGRNNSGVPPEFGDYVYSYFICPQTPTVEQQGPEGVGLIVHRPGAIFLSRAPKDSLFLARENHRFYCGLDENGDPLWGSVDQKQPVVEDPSGVGWCMSACYVPGLERVLLCTEHDASSQGTLGLFDAPAPWGPWTTVKYYEQSAPFGAHRPGSGLPWRSNVFFAAFPAKWLDGLDFTLNFTGAGQGKDNDSFNTVRGRFLLR